MELWRLKFVSFWQMLGTRMELEADCTYIVWSTVLLNTMLGIYCICCNQGILRLGSRCACRTAVLWVVWFRCLKIGRKGEAACACIFIMDRDCSAPPLVLVASAGNPIAFLLGICNVLGSSKLFGCSKRWMEFEAACDCNVFCNKVAEHHAHWSLHLQW